jgi:DNA invertase Pin-like site-specific DNA recombinase
MEKTLKTEAPKPKAVGYVRVSSKEQAEDGTSLEAQREAIIREAVHDGFDLLDIFEDGGISGGKGERSRPGLASALDAIRFKKAAALIVKHADRLARSTDLAGYFRVMVEEAGGRVVVIDEAKDDPIRNAVDKMVAELERIRASQRMKSWNAHRKAHGLPTGPPAFGFEKDAAGRLRPNPAEARVVRMIVQAKKRLSLRALAAKLNADSVPMRGRSWNSQQVFLVLRRAQAAKSPNNSPF